MTRLIRRDRFFSDLGYSPHPGQAAVHESDAPRRVVACGTRWGKTTCAAMEALAAMMGPCPSGTIGWVVAPTYDLADRVWGTMERVALERLSPWIVDRRRAERRLVLRNLAGGESEARAKTADNPVSLLGEGLDWLIVDEAARIRPSIWESHLSQRLVDRRGWAMMISTSRGRNWFYDQWLRGRDARDPAYESWQQPTVANPHIDPSLIEAERSRLPEAIWRQEYEAAFIEGSGAVFRRVRQSATATPLARPRAGRHYTAGLDLARTTDWTVLTIVDDTGCMVAWDRWQRIDWTAQIGRVMAMLQRWDHPTTWVDATGVGDPIVEALERAGARVKPVRFSARVKADLIDHLAVALERGDVTLLAPEHYQAGIDELESFAFEMLPSGSTRTSAPSGMHDDCVISLALALWGGRRHVTLSGGLLLPSRATPTLTTGWDPG